MSENESNGIIFRIPDNVTDLSETQFQVPEGLQIVGLVVSGHIRSVNWYFCPFPEIRSLVLEEGVEEIRKNAFCGCELLETVQLPDSLRRIGDGAFQLTALWDVSLPEGLETIGAFAFSNCVQLSSVSFPSTLKEIGEGAFHFTALAEVALPDGIRELGFQVFAGCRFLREVRFPASLRRILTGAFLETGVTDLVFPEGLEEIGKQAFWHCASLESVRFPSSLREIGERAFKGTGLRSLELPEGLQSLGEAAFYGCLQLQTVRLPSTLRQIPKNAFASTDLNALSLPEGIREIGENAFGSCRELVRVSLPGSLRTIGPFAFNDTALREVEVPEGVEVLDKCAFARCPSLRDARLPASLRVFGYQSFAISGIPSVLSIRKNPLRLVVSGIPEKIESQCLFRASRVVLLCEADKSDVVRLLDRLNLLDRCELEADRIPLRSLPGSIQTRIFRTWEKRLTQGEVIPDEARSNLLDGLKARKAAIWRSGSGVLRQILLDEGLLSLQNVRAFLEDAQREGDSELVARLLDYENRHFPPEEVERRERKKRQRALKDLPAPEEKGATEARPETGP